jgi:hypothetical protein
VVVAARHHPHETALRLQAHGPAVGGKRELRDDAVQALLAGLFRGRADHHHFRVGEAHGGDRAGSKRRALPAMISATISPWAMARCASIGSPATSPMAQTLCMLVWQRSSMAMARRSSSGQAFQVEALGARATTDGHQYLVGLQAQLSPLPSLASRQPFS